MTPLLSEARRVRFELGYNVMSSGVEPFINTFETLDTILQTYLTAGAITTSATAVSAAAVATPSTLTLTSSTGFADGEMVWIDVDARQESATVQSLSGSGMTVLLTKEHSGAYPVTVDGGETIIRDILTKLRNLAEELGGSAVVAAGIEQADEIRFSVGGQARDSKLRELQMFWRDQLAGALGVPNKWPELLGGGTRLEAY